MSLLGEEVKGTRAWQEQMEMLRDVGYFLRQQLLDLKLEKYTDRGKWESPSEQVMRLGALIVFMLKKKRKRMLVISKQPSRKGRP